VAAAVDAVAMGRRTAAAADVAAAMATVAMAATTRQPWQR